MFNLLPDYQRPLDIFMKTLERHKKSLDPTNPIILNRVYPRDLKMLLKKMKEIKEMEELLNEKAARSIIFRNMLESDECKAPPGQSITLPELNHGELDSLLELLYSGSLSDEKMEKRAYSLAIASHKYEIPFLPKFCESWMLRSLKPSTALDILEISDSCSNETLQKTAINFILKNSGDIILNSDRFDAFALKNPHLSVRLTRDLLMVIKKSAVTL